MAQTTLGNVSLGALSSGIPGEYGRERLDDLYRQLKRLDTSGNDRGGDSGRRLRQLIAEEKGRLKRGFTMDDLIQQRSPQAIDLLMSGADEQIRLSELGQQAALDPLQGQIDPRAFDEQQALLGLRGQEAQEQAIGGIPVSEFDRQLQARQGKQLRRRLNAAGELGGGASFEAQSQLAGYQMGDVIRQRLSQLSPLVQMQRGIAQDVSSITEQGLADRANIQNQLGGQIGGIRLGVGAQQVATTQNQALLSGLRGVQRANEQAQYVSQLGNLAGNFMGAQRG